MPGSSPGKVTMGAAGLAIKPPSCHPRRSGGRGRALGLRWAVSPGLEAGLALLARGEQAMRRLDVEEGVAAQHLGVFDGALDLAAVAEIVKCSGLTPSVCALWRQRERR